MEGYNTKLDLRIDWSEMDLFGHVNNVAFFKYIQAARVNYWELVGLTKLHKEENIGLMLASSKCDFKKPLFFPGNLSIVSKIAYVKTTSFSLHHLILNNKKEICAEAEDVMVLYDFTKHEKVPFPADILRNIDKREK
jgi:acyl-CoA thioester hydrolase